jgi:hypothetical protein
MTRCFGWSLPGTMILPFADFLNHKERAIDHELVNLRYEIQDEENKKRYNFKINNLSFKIFILKIIIKIKLTKL